MTVLFFLSWPLYSTLVPSPHALAHVVLFVFCAFVEGSAAAKSSRSRRSVAGASPDAFATPPTAMPSRKHERGGGQACSTRSLSACSKWSSHGQDRVREGQDAYGSGADGAGRLRQCSAVLQSRSFCSLPPCLKTVIGAEVCAPVAMSADETETGLEDTAEASSSLQQATHATVFVAEQKLTNGPCQGCQACQDRQDRQGRLASRGRCAS
ncbi:hypothetical protein BJ546DRAFT_532247 [Cryomyces antarcticus]